MYGVQQIKLDGLFVYHCRSGFVKTEPCSVTSLIDTRVKMWKTLAGLEKEKVMWIEQLDKNGEQVEYRFINENLNRVYE
jgi:hypothetical protein